MSFWITLISGVIVTAGTGVALGAALGLTGLFILQFYSNGATSGCHRRDLERLQFIYLERRADVHPSG